MLTHYHGIDSRLLEPLTMTKEANAPFFSRAVQRLISRLKYPKHSLTIVMGNGDVANKRLMFLPAM